MATIFHSDLNHFNSKSFTIKMAGRRAKSIGKQIENFINNSGDKLVGGGFDAIRSHLSLYAEAYNNIANLCEILANNNRAVNNKMSNFMDTFSELNDDYISEFESEISRVKLRISELEESEDFFKTANLYFYRRQLDGLKRIYDKIRELKPTDGALASEYSATESDVRKLSQAVDGIEVIDFTSL